MWRRNSIISGKKIRSEHRIELYTEDFFCAHRKFELAWKLVRSLFGHETKKQTLTITLKHKVDTLCDPNTQDVARLEKSIKKHEPLDECFLAFFKQHPKCLDTLNLRKVFYLFKVTTINFKCFQAIVNEQESFSFWQVWSATHCELRC